jgi:hypothetical protein
MVLARRIPMIERKAFGQVDAGNHGQFKTTFSFYDWDLKHAVMICLALALLGGLVTTTAVAMIAYLLLTNSHI